MSFFSKNKPDWKRLEQKEPPVSELPEMPKPQRPEIVVLSPAEAEEVKKRLDAEEKERQKTIPKLDSNQVYARDYLRQHQQENLTHEESLAIFEYYLAKLIETYQEMKLNNSDEKIALFDYYWSKAQEKYLVLKQGGN